jgi:hypothetical protein
MNQFFLGVTVAAATIAGLFFLRFWTRTRDRLFLLFALAFWLMGANWASLAWFNRDEPTLPFLYLFRLAAFLLIVIAILDKNRARTL